MQLISNIILAIVAAFALITMACMAQTVYSPQVNELHQNLVSYGGPINSAVSQGNGGSNPNSNAQNGASNGGSSNNGTLGNLLGPIVNGL